MQLHISQRLLSWTDSYDVCDASGQPRYEVRARLLSLGHQIRVFDKQTGEEVGFIRQKLLSLLPQFEILIGDVPQGTIRRELTFLRQRYHVDFRGWDVEGDFMGWDFRVMDADREVMSIHKDLLRWTDTYVLEYANPKDELPGLMLVIAIDAANSLREE